MNLKYVDINKLRTVIGKYAPISTDLLSLIIDEALVNTNLGYVHTEAGKGRFFSDPKCISDSLKGISDKLLKHNRLLQKKRKKWVFYNELDFDIVHESNYDFMNNGTSVNTSIKAYFFYTQFSRPFYDRRVVFHLNHHTINGTQWSISFPIQSIMKHYPIIKNSHFGYSHSISIRDDNGYFTKPQMYYIGITKRNWLKRMSEHFYEIQKGSNKLFHSAWREYSNGGNALLSSELIVLNHTYNEIMEWEEWAVDNQFDSGTSLNMIPGGFKGLRYLYKKGLLKKHKASLSQRQVALKKIQKEKSDSIIPNFIISDMWKDPIYAEKVICNAEGHLSSKQVRQIRELHARNYPIELIVNQVNAKNRLQVSRVIKGITYSRITKKAKTYSTHSPM